MKHNQLKNHQNKETVSLRIPQKDTGMQLLADANRLLTQPFTTPTLSQTFLTKELTDTNIYKECLHIRTVDKTPSNL